MRCAFSWATRPAANGCDPDGNPAGGDIACAVVTPDAVRVLIGDVMGHDPRAAHTAAEVTRAFRRLAAEPDPLQVVAARLHAFVAAHADGEEFVTAQFIAVPNGDDAEAQIVCCGHPPPLLLRDGSAAFIEPYAAPPLGLLDLAEGWCRASMIPVGDGDQLLLYTDGVSEARDAAGQFFPLAQVTADTVHGTGPDRAPLLDVLVARLDEHVGDRACDDILLLLVTMR